MPYRKPVCFFATCVKKNVMFVYFFVFPLYINQDCISLQKKTHSDNDRNHGISAIFCYFPLTTKRILRKRTSNRASSTDIEMQYRKGAAVAISCSLQKCINKGWKVYKAAAVYNNSPWHYGYSFVDGKRNKVTAQTNFFHLHSSEKVLKTVTNLAVNIQCMLPQNSHRRQRKEKKKT